MSKENMTVFKAYLRNLMRQLRLLQQELEKNDIDAAKKVLNDIIEDTQSSIED